MRTIRVVESQFAEKWGKRTVTGAGERHAGPEIVRHMISDKRREKCIKKSKYILGNTSKMEKEENIQ